MTYLTHIPGAPLSQFVNKLWLCEGNSSDTRKERVLPSGEMQVIVNLRGGAALLSGARSAYTVIDAPGSSYLIGAHFRPGGAHPFFRLPAGELHNMAVSLETIWQPTFAESFRCRLLEAPSPRLKFAIFERALLQQLVRPLERHAAVAFALQAFANAPSIPTVSSVAGQLGISWSRFIQVFRDQVGLTPKVFCRITRFQNALRQISRQQNVNWAEVALDCGYFDQAHFIHDFRGFSGINPSTYVARRTPFLNHVAEERHRAGAALARVKNSPGSGRDRLRCAAEVPDEG